MNLIIFAFALILFDFTAPGAADAGTVDILPDFVGYLLLWYTLEKRRINDRMRGVYTAVSIMIPLSFLVFLSQIQEMFLPSLIEDGRNTGWILLDMVLSVVSVVYIKFGGILLFLAALITAWFLFAMLAYWDQKQENRKQRLICKGGIILCGLIGLVYLITAFIPNFPFSPHWITYPLTVPVLAVVWYSMKEVSEMETGIRN